MPNVCKICTHDKRLEIDRLLVSGRSKASISREYGVSECSLANHAANHLSRQLLKHTEVRERISSERVIDEIEDILSRSKRILRDSEADGQRGMALGAIREIRSTLEFLSKLAITLQQIQRQEANVEDDQEDMEQRERISKLELCELTLLGDLQSKINGEKPWRRLLPPEFYKDEDDSINIRVDVPKDAGIEPERVIIRPDDQGGSTAVKSSSIADHFVDLPEQESMEEQEPMEPEALKEFMTPEPEPADSKPAMTRGKPLNKIYYGPNMSKSAARREAKAIIRNTGKMPREQWLRDAL